MFSLYATAATFFVVLNVLFCALQIGLLRRRKPWPKFLAVAACIWAVLMIGLFLLQLFAPSDWRPILRRWFYLPIAVEMVWNLIFLQVLVLGGIILTLALRWWKPVRPSDPPPSSADLSRRKFVYLLACSATPATALGMGVHGSLSRYDLRVRRFDIPIADLAPDLEGFTIAHVSDLHSGIFCGPRRLKIISDTTNDLNADLIAIPGDFINNNMGEFPDVLACMLRLRSRRGIYLSQGNHDVIPGPTAVQDGCVENGFPFLLNDSAIVPVGRARLIIGGLPWMAFGYEGHPELVSRLYPEREEGDLRILLGHHPHLFDIAQSSDLVLSGHTHGGQIMAGDVGFGPLFFKYWSGLYRRDHTTMIVSNGCGDWFPCRIGAPAEVGLLKLTRA